MRFFVMRSSNDMEDKAKENLENHQKAYIAFLADVLEDRKRDSYFHKVVIGLLIGVIVALIGGLVYLSIRTQDKLEAMSDRSEKRMYEFLSEYDFTGTIDLDTGTVTDSSNSGYITYTNVR